ncbi:hypothetical protein AB6A40_003774 [Gnathostoma spinigerum]|uniref:Strawberry notch AAA domain-containing protein n=1 Tax=Gnathostoma spinigerum TaxID=75299 RepID=A0ABD6EBP1_9BILA
MGDLLSAALTEAGLDEFLSEPSSPDDRLFENIVPVNQTSNNVGTSFHEECILQPSCSQELHLPRSDSAESIESIRDIKQVSDEGREIRNCPQAKSSDSSPLVKQSASNCGESSRGPVNSVLSKSNQTNSDQTIYARSLSTKQPNLKRLPADHLDVARCLTNRTSPLSHGETQTTHPKQIEKIAMCDSAKSPSSRQIPGTSPPELFVECDLTDRTTQSTQFTTEDVPSGTHRSFTYGPAILRSRRSILVDNTKIVRGVSGRTLLQRTNASPVYRAVTGTRTLVRTGPPVRTVIRNQTPINRTATGRSQQRIVVVRQSSPNDTVPYMGHPHETMIRTNSSPHLRTVMVRQNGTIVRRQRAVGQRITEWSGPYATPAFHISRRISSPLRENSQLTCSSFRAERGPRYVASSPSPPLAAYSRSPSHSSCLSQVPPGGGPVLRKVNTSLGSAGSMIMNSPRFAGSNQIRATRDGQPSHAYLALPAVAASAAYPSTLSRSMKRSASSPQTMNGVEEVATTPCSYAETRRDQIGVQTKVSDYDVNSRGGILLTSQSNRLVSHRDRKQQWQVDELLIPSGKVENIKTDESIPVNVAITKGYLLGSTTGSVERRNTVKQERRLAKDEMKAALEAGIEKSMQEMDDEEENLGYAETYSEYRPAKLRSGLSHPDSVVETASLSSVAPPEVRYNVSIPEELIDTGSISAIQLEAVIYACQAHESRLPSGERSGYLIGDGAGVGKGRTVACIIFENYLLGRKRSLWLSVSSDLKFDAERDLRDIGAKNIKVHALNKFKYAKISGKENGNVKKGCVFATYSSLIGECRTAKSKYRSRLKQLIQWCGQVTVLFYALFIFII